MRIGVNVRLLIQNRIDGISRFSYESLKRIVTNHPEHTFIFYFDRKFDPSFVFNSNVVPVVVPPPTRHPLLINFWTDYTLPVFMKKHKPEIFVSTDGFLPLKTKVPCLPVVHDLNFIHNPEWMPPYLLKFYKKRFPLIINKAARIATVSEFSKKDIINQFGILGSKIDVVYNGVSEKFKPSNSEEKLKTRNEYSGGKPYLLFVGSVHPRKNLVNTLKAFEEYCKKSNTEKVLLIAGEMYFGNEQLKNTLNEMQFKDRVIFAGAVDDSLLVKLYGAADTFVYASYFEGFGIPVLEAMQCGVPVITSDRSSLPEVVGDAAIMVDPDNYRQMSDSMLEADHLDLRTKLINLGLRRCELFSWDNTASLFWNSIEQTIQDK